MVNLRSIVRGAVTRVLPGFLLAWTVFVASSPITRSNVTPGRIVFSILLAGAAALGSALALGLMRRRLREDAAVDGRRGFLVGLGAMAVTLVVRPFLPHIPAIGEFALAALSGAAVSGSVFFPWLSASASGVASHEGAADAARAKDSLTL